MRLLDAEDFPRLRLRETPLLDQSVDAQRKVCLKVLAFGARKSQVGKDVAAALCESQTRGLSGEPSVCFGRPCPATSFKPQRRRARLPKPWRRQGTDFEKK